MDWQAKMNEITRVLNDNQVTSRQIAKQAVLAWMIEWASKAEDKNATPAIDMMMQMVGQVVEEVFGFSMMKTEMEILDIEDDIAH